MTTGKLGILGYGAYVPRRRLERSAITGAYAWFNGGAKGRGRRAMAGWDEDSLTMAVEAARDCLGGAPALPVPSTVLLATTTAPFSERLNAGVVKEALNLSDATLTMDVGGARRAGVTALYATLRGGGSTGAGATLLIASDKPPVQPGSDGELTAGDGAAAVLIGAGEPVAEMIGGHASSVDFVDRFRASDQPFDYGWESRWIRDLGYDKIVVSAVMSALADASVSPADVSTFLMPTSVKGVAEKIAKSTGIDGAAVHPGLGADLGEAGCAQPILLLAHALERAKAGEVIVLASFGSGCDVVVLRTTERVADVRPRLGLQAQLDDGLSTVDYMRWLVFNNLVPMDRGMRAEMDQKTPLTALYRERKAVLGLVGGRCTETGTVQFPRSEISVNPNAHTVRTQEDYRFADIPARVVTYTADRLSYTIDPPFWYGTVEFDGGGRMVAEFADAEPQDVEVGAEMRMVFRIRSRDEVRGFHRYFWKATPVRTGAAQRKETV